MKSFITLHETKTNELICLNINEIVCFICVDKRTRIYIKGDETDISVNEKPSVILKKIGDYRKFVLVHTKSANNELAIAVDLIKVVAHSSANDTTLVVLTDDSFADLEVNESVTSIAEMLDN